MKKIIAVAAVVAIAAAGIQSANAGNREWATVGKVLTGVAAGVVLASAVDARASSYTVTYSAPAPVVYAPAPVVYAPAPVVVQAPAQVVYVPAPRPAVIYPAPVYVTPRPYVNFSYHGGHRHRHWGNPHCR